MDEIRLGGANLSDLPSQISLIPTSRTRWISPVPKRLAGRGALPRVLGIPGQRHLPRGSTGAFQTGSDQDSLAGAMPNRSGSCLPSNYMVFGRSPYPRESRMLYQVVCGPGYGVKGKVSAPLMPRVM